MRFFFLVDPPATTKGPWQPPVELRKHLRALRFSPGQSFLLLLADGTALEAQMADRDLVEIIDSAEVPTLPLSQITLVTAWPKGKRAEDLVVRACESGVSRIQPLLCERSVAGRDEFSSRQLQRLEKLARETCQQVRQPHPPKINRNPIRLAEVADSFKNAQVICLMPASPPLVELPRLPEKAEIVLLVGPEGGFSDLEVERMEQQEWAFAGILPTILRIEAAGPMAAALLQHRDSHPDRCEYQ